MRVLVVKEVAAPEQEFSYAMHDSKQYNSFISCRGNWQQRQQSISCNSNNEEPIEIVFDDDGQISLLLPITNCGNASPLPPSSFEQGRIEWIQLNDLQSSCKAYDGRAILEHSSGTNWSLRIERGSPTSAILSSALTFQCNNACTTTKLRCSSEFNDIVLGFCTDFVNDNPQGNNGGNANNRSGAATYTHDRMVSMMTIVLVLISWTEQLF